MKHALILRIIAYLQRKDTPIRIVDTHAGIGLYDLTADEAERTGEWADGIGRLDRPFDAPVEQLLNPFGKSSRRCAQGTGRRPTRVPGHRPRDAAPAGPRRLRGTAPLTTSS